MVHSVSGWTRGVQVKLWDPSRTRAIPERLAVITRRYTNPRLPLPLPNNLPLHLRNAEHTFLEFGRLLKTHLFCLDMHQNAPFICKSTNSGRGTAPNGEGMNQLPRTPYTRSPPCGCSKGRVRLKAWRVCTRVEEMEMTVQNEARWRQVHCDICSAGRGDKA